MHPHPRPFGVVLAIGHHHKTLVGRIGRGPIPQPQRVGGRQIHAAVRVLEAELVVPVRAVQRHVFIEVHRVRHVFQEVVIGLAFAAAHLGLAHLHEDAEQARIGVPLRQTR